MKKVVQFYAIIGCLVLAIAWAGYVLIYVPNQPKTTVDTMIENCERDPLIAAAWVIEVEEEFGVDFSLPERITALPMAERARELHSAFIEDPAFLRSCLKTFREFLAVPRTSDAPQTGTSDSVSAPLKTASEPVPEGTTGFQGRNRGDAEMLPPTVFQIRTQ